MRRPSPQTQRVLDALYERPDRWWHGYELAKSVDLKSGTLYPILIRLGDRGFLDHHWETPEPGARPRHVYRLTSSGKTYAAEWRRSASALTATQLGGAHP